jgi:hypothetical protein
VRFQKWLRLFSLEIPESGATRYYISEFLDDSLPPETKELVQKISRPAKSAPLFSTRGATFSS